MNDKLYEIVTDLLLRLSSLEQTLLKKGVITEEDYINSIKDTAEKFTKVVQQLMSEKSNKDETSSN